MLHTLNQIDQAVFLFINQQLANPATDFIMPFITSDILLRVIYAVGILLLLWKGNRRLRWMVLFSAIVLTLTDQIVANYLKHWIERPRPCHTMDELHLLIACGGGFSMPSAHAANVFGQAILFSFDYKIARPYLLTFASLVAISRVFVGVHYPGDIIVGSAIGALIGLALAVIFARVYATWLKGKEKRVDHAV